MNDRELSAVEENLTESARGEIESIEEAYDTVRAEAEQAGTPVDVDVALGEEIERTVEKLKRARQWEHQIEFHEKGILNHHQLIEQVDDDAFAIEATINTADREIDGATDTIVALREEVAEELSAALGDLNEALERQRDHLETLNETLSSVHNSMMDDGVTWME